MKQTAAFLVACGIFASFASAQTYDIVIQNGHVIDPRNGIDSVPGTGRRLSSILSTVTSAPASKPTARKRNVTKTSVLSTMLGRDLDGVQLSRVRRPDQERKNSQKTRRTLTIGGGIGGKAHDGMAFADEQAPRAWPHLRNRSRRGHARVA